jgi:hypothetical protein
LIRSLKQEEYSVSQVCKVLKLPDSSYLNVRSKAEDWIDALNMAVDNNCPLGSREYDLNLMSDNGSQPTF